MNKFSTASLSKNRKKRRTLSLAEKKSIIESREIYNQTFEELARAFGADRSTISKIVKEKHVYLNAFNKLSRNAASSDEAFVSSCSILRIDQMAKYEPVETKLLEWLNTCQTTQTISRCDLQEKAYQICLKLKEDGCYLPEKPLPIGWIDSFIKKYKIVCENFDDKELGNALKLFFYSTFKFHCNIKKCREFN